jgi:penicillin amidase
MIEGKAKWGVQDMHEIHGDAYSVHADDVLTPLQGFLDYLGYITINPNLDPDLATVRSAANELQKWDRRSTRDSAGATIFEAFWVQLAHAIFDDELGIDLAKDALDTGTATKAAVRNMLSNLDSEFWDDVNTSEKETHKMIVQRALLQAANQLTALMGKDMAQWQWGKVHVITFRNQTLGKSGVAPIEAIFNRGPFAVEGATSAVNAQSHKPDDFSVRAHLSWRMVVDLSDFNKSIAIHPTGQSGHAFHPHYDDMMQPWLAVQYNPLYWQRSDVTQNSEGTLILTP